MSSREGFKSARQDRSHVSYGSAASGLLLGFLYLPGVVLRFVQLQSP